jgi:hypothetical protein
MRQKLKDLVWLFKKSSWRGKYPVVKMAEPSTDELHSYRSEAVAAEVRGGHHVSGPASDYSLGQADPEGR